MKYAITGHTKGIGLKTFKRLDPNIIGFSRSNGYDINKKNDRQKIVEESYDCDVFINNATDNFSQSYMLIDILNAWINLPDKRIINVGSRIAEYDALTGTQYTHLRYYHAEKSALKFLSEGYTKTAKCKIDYRWFAYVGTAKILAKYPHFTPEDYISEDAAVDIILS
jgi:hypothetical protein